MTVDDWKSRLTAALDESGKSHRAVSLEAKCGPGYIHSILNEGKEPSLVRLMRICDVIPADPIWIIHGITVSREDQKVLEALRDNPDSRNAILMLLSSKSG